MGKILKKKHAYFGIVLVIAISSIGALADCQYIGKVKFKDGTSGTYCYDSLDLAVSDLAGACSGNGVKNYEIYQAPSMSYVTGSSDCN